jgi:hypothetical protein
MIPYQDLTPDPVDFPPRKEADYRRPATGDYNYVPLVYGAEYDDN